ncbi:CocE/NonD family hydrolase [Nocardioidaceae bacterium SCSIO 66511]|nr:CocE/NonD family hydrolase [Nocardioidaceae bacterium SCSIO 66511]
MTSPAITDRPLDTFPRSVTETEHTWIPMPDGTRLAARIWMPEDAVDNPVPGILEFIPYRKNDGTHQDDATKAPYFAGHGYAVVRVDLRGTGDSEGVIEDEYTQQELDDGVATIAWIAAQPWCLGKVGIMGISWGGFNGLQIAAEQPPELAAVLTLCSTDDRYADDVHYFGGQLLADQQLSWATTMLAYDARPPDPNVWGDGWLDAWKQRLDATPPFIDTWMTHQRRDEFWQHGSVCENPEAIQCPVMLVSGWADAYRDAVLRMLATLTVPRRGIIGPWVHLWPQVAPPGPQIGFLQEALRWWDRWLKDEPNGIEDEPVLLSYLQDTVPPRASYDERPGRWLADQHWPSEHVTVQPARLTSQQTAVVNGEATNDDRTLSVTSVQPHGIAGGRSIGYSLSYEQAVDQRIDDGYALCFDTGPLDEPLDILGIPEAELTLTSNRPRAMVAVRLVDVAPDGTATLITRGLLNLAHRDSHEEPTDVPVDTPITVRFPLHAIGYKVPPGHRLRIAIAPTLWPMVWPSPTPVTLGVTAAQSAVHLPVHVPAAEVPFPFTAPEQAAYSHTKLPADETGTVTRDLASGRTTVVYENSGGDRLPEEHGSLTHWAWERDTFDIEDTDPTAARATSEREIKIERGTWRTRIEATAQMTCDTDTFYVTTELHAYSDDHEVFTRRWEMSFARDYT